MFSQLKKVSNSGVRNITRVSSKKTNPTPPSMNIVVGLVMNPTGRSLGIAKTVSNMINLKSHKKQFELEELLYISTKNFDANATKSAFDQIMRANIVPSLEMYACCLSTCLFTNNGQRTLFYLTSLTKQPHAKVPGKFGVVVAKIFELDNSPAQAAIFAELGKKEYITSEELKEAVKKAYESPRYKLVVQ